MWRSHRPAATAAFVTLTFLAADAALAQDAAKKAPGQRPAPVVSPEVHSDRSVTFRLRAPEAKAVSVSVEGATGSKPMEKDERGVWSATIGPLAPEIYGYGFVVDGLRVIDPGNSRIKPQRSPNTSILDIPGDPPLIHDVRDVPRGTVRLHEYRSAPLNGARRRLRVYTPPGYDRDPSARYPVLYLLHGAGDNEATWTELGHAHVILDNLIADGKAKPMIVVMTDGHASPPGAPGGGGRNFGLDAYRKDLLEAVMPLIERDYRTVADREHRAIVGLSMGGMQSMSIGLNALDRFAWVGGMSGFVPEPETTLAAPLAEPEKTNEKLRLFWVAIGKDDFLLGQARQLEDVLTKHGIRRAFQVTEGNHSWPVWRKYLAEFAPLIFVEASR